MRSVIIVQHLFGLLESRIPPASMDGSRLYSYSGLPMSVTSSGTTRRVFTLHYIKCKKGIAESVFPSR